MTKIKILFKNGHDLTTKTEQSFDEVCLAIFSGTHYIANTTDDTPGCAFPVASIIYIREIKEG